MSDGLDREQAETAEAVTLLQLLQGIDVESHLPKDLLNVKFNEPVGSKNQIRLKRVLIDQVTEDKKFSSRLCASLRRPKDPDSSVANLGNGTDVAGVPTALIADANQSAPVAATSTVEMGKSSNIMGGEVPAIGGSSSTSSSTQRIERDIEAKSAFEVIALALRHQAKIEVKSSLLADDSVSYDIEELKTYFPNIVEVGKMGTASDIEAFDNSILSLPVSFI
jgi:hypothetical protein